MLRRPRRRRPRAQGVAWTFNQLPRSRRKDSLHSPPQTMKTAGPVMGAGGRWWLWAFVVYSTRASREAPQDEQCLLSGGLAVPHFWQVTLTDGGAEGATGGTAGGG